MASSSGLGVSASSASGLPGASKKRREHSSTEVLLYAGRLRLLLVAAIQLSIGGLLLFRLGTIGQYIGGFLIAFGLLRIYRSVRIGFGDEGVIALAKKVAHLPRELCGGDDNIKRVTLAEIENVFYLRRSLSWIRSSPVLIVETASRVYRYPRSWFASDYDQRRIGFALNRALGRSLSKDLVSPPRPNLTPTDELTESDRRNRAVVFFILAGGLVMIANLGLHGFLVALGLPTYVVYVAAGFCIATGLFYLFVPSSVEKESAEVSSVGRSSESRGAKGQNAPPAKAQVERGTGSSNRGMRPKRSSKSKRK